MHSICKKHRAKMKWSRWTITNTWNTQINTYSAERERVCKCCRGKSALSTREISCKQGKMFQMPKRTWSSCKLVTLNECSCTMRSSRYNCCRCSSNFTSSSLSCRNDCFCLDANCCSWWCRENSSILLDGGCWSTGNWC